MTHIQEHSCQYNFLAINGSVGEGGLFFAPLDSEEPQNILAVMPQGDARAIMVGIQIEKKLSSLSIDNDEVLRIDGWHWVPREEWCHHD